MDLFSEGVNEDVLFVLFSSGWISSITMIRSNMAVAVVMMVVAGCFTVNAVLAIILLKMVHFGLSQSFRIDSNFIEVLRSLWIKHPPTKANTA